jgi:hypothetical protein
MKYMLLMQGNKDGWDKLASWAPEDVQRMMTFMDELNAELAQKGELVQAIGLAGPQHLKTVHIEDGDVVVTDGPFPETKEVLAGYWILDVDSEERVLEIARRITQTPGPGGEPTNQPVDLHLIPDQDITPVTDL